jgi:phosphoglycerol transferase MdoB-like AlkP superfamily enzyme
MKNKIKIIVNLLLPLGIFYCLENFTHDITTMAFMPQLINYLIFLIAGILLSTLFGTTMVAGILLCLFTLGLGIANYFVLAFRGNPILPWDLKSISTALSVADNYNFTIDSRFIISTVGLLILLVLSIIVRVKVSHLKKRLGIAVLCVFALIGARTALCTTAITDNLLTFTNLFTQWASYRDNGFVVSFLQNTQYISIKKPTGYDSDKLESELEPYLEEQETSEKQPNIIVIMNESFSDLSVLHEFETSEDYMPFIHSLQNSDEAITGNLYVSVCGGNTANTEFEFLTGDTMAFLPSGSVAYQQYISDNLPSWVTSLANQGYQTVAMHPYNATGWNRNKVYPYLGFETSYFKNDFTNAKILRKYISDESLYDKVIDVYDNKEDSPLFLFAVTMQNHGGYSQLYDNFPISVTLTDIKNHPGTENYLSLVKESDRAFEELVDYFRTVDEDTIIVMFGDHQPNDYVANCIARLTGTADDDKTLEEQQNRYLVPFVIWANYDIEASHDITTSANYLNLLVSQTAGIELSDYQQYLLTLQEEFPVITANLLVDKEGTYSAVSDLESLQLYKKLQYMHLFDTKNRIDGIYEKK